MTPLRLLLAALLGSASLAAEDNTFAPVESAIIHQDLADYTDFLQASVFQHLSDQSPVGFAFLSPTTPEWSLQIIMTDEEECTIRVETAATNLWRAGRFGGSTVENSMPREERYGTLLPQVKTTVAMRDVNRNVGKRVIAVWQRIVSRAQFGKLRPTGADGEILYFFANNQANIVFAGKQSRPDPQSGPGRLAALAQVLRKIAEEKPGAAEELTQLLTELNALYPPA
jgi:hypothetical protein